MPKESSNTVQQRKIQCGYFPHFYRARHAHFRAWRVDTFNKEKNDGDLNLINGQFGTQLAYNFVRRKNEIGDDENDRIASATAGCQNTCQFKPKAKTKESEYLSRFHATNTRSQKNENKSNRAFSHGENSTWAHATTKYRQQSNGRAKKTRSPKR